MKSVVQIEAEEDAEVAGVTANNNNNNNNNNSGRSRAQSNATSLPSSPSPLKNNNNNNVIDSIDKSVSVSSTPPVVPINHRRTNSIYVTPFVNVIKGKAATNVQRDKERLPRATQMMNIRVIKGIVELPGDKLAILTSVRPELAEFVALEIQNMKLASKLIVEQTK
jgi:hypothetical protein